MSRTLARLAVIALAPLTAAAVALTGASTSSAEGTTPAVHVEQAAQQRITLNVPGCDGCTMTLNQYDGGADRAWSSATKTVEDGRVSWLVPAEHAHDLSVAMNAPWERRLGYVTQVVFRYGGEQTGDAITIAQARQEKRGSLCLAGDTDRRKLTVDVTARRVKVRGIGGQTSGTLAFASVTQPLSGELNRVFNGVGGAQDVPPCG